MYFTSEGKGRMGIWVDGKRKKWVDEGKKGENNYEELDEEEN